MASAIFLAGLVIGGAISPDWVASNSEDFGAAEALGLFMIYDMLRLVSRK